MAPITDLKIKCLFFVVISIIVSCTTAIHLASNSESSNICLCDPVKKNFDQLIDDQVNKTCRKCYVFTYDFTLNQVSTYLNIYLPFCMFID